MLQRVSARIRGSMGAQPDTRPRSLLGRIACSSRGGSGEGPGRENSLASLANSLSHTPRTGVARPVVSITLG
jgi:hypothetical protein